MKKLLLLLILGLIGIIPIQAAPAHPVYAALANPGVNAQWGLYAVHAWNPNFNDAELANIRAAGFTHVRYPITMDNIEQGQTGQLRADRADQIVALMQRTIAAGLLPYPEIHAVYICGAPYRAGCNWTDDYVGPLKDAAVRKRHQEISVALLTRIAASIPTTQFAFAAANEPIFDGSGGRGAPSVWYTYQRQLIAALRAACAGCVIGAMSNDWQGIEAAIQYLTPWPWKGDPYVFLDAHYYGPMGLTHCRSNCGSVVWPGTFNEWNGAQYFDKARLKREIQRIYDWGQREGVYVHFSEVGTNNSTPTTTRARYMGDLAEVLAEFNIGASWYVWKNDQFGFGDTPELVRAVTGSTPSQPTVVPPTFAPTNTPQAPIPPTPTPSPNPIPSCQILVYREEVGLSPVLIERRAC